jgi:hypothetical protein
LPSRRQRAAAAASQCRRSELQEIADREDQTAGAITARIMLPKHPMPQIPLTKAELADLAAYILSLRDADKP